MRMRSVISKTVQARELDAQHRNYPEDGGQDGTERSYVGEGKGVEAGSPSSWANVGDSGILFTHRDNRSWPKTGRRLVRESDLVGSQNQATSQSVWLESTHRHIAQSLGWNTMKL